MAVIRGLKRIANIDTKFVYNREAIKSELKTSLLVYSRVYILAGVHRGAAPHVLWFCFYLSEKCIEVLFYEALDKYMDKKEVFRNINRSSLLLKYCAGDLINFPKDKG